MRKTLVTTTMVVALAFGAVAPAVAAPGNGQGPGLERGNWLSGVATPVELEPEAITFSEINGVAYVRVQHDIGDYAKLVQREPARYKQNVVDETGGSFNAAWLGITDAEGTPVAHRGQLAWYYEVSEGEWVSLTFQFDGEGELLHVNGVSAG
jgi:hypothetical protein